MILHTNKHSLNIQSLLGGVKKEGAQIMHVSFKQNRKICGLGQHTSQISFNKCTKISMVKSGREFFILKFTESLQSCSCLVQTKSARKAELTWQVSRYLRRGSVNFKIKNSRPLFTIEILVHLLKEIQLVCRKFYGFV